MSTLADMATAITGLEEAIIDKRLAQNRLTGNLAFNDYNTLKFNIIPENQEDNALAKYTKYLKPGLIMDMFYQTEDDKAKDETSPMPSNHPQN